MMCVKTHLENLTKEIKLNPERLVHIEDITNATKDTVKTEVALGLARGEDRL